MCRIGRPGLHISAVGLGLLTHRRLHGRGRPAAGLHRHRRRRVAAGAGLGCRPRRHPVHHRGPQGAGHSARLLAEASATAPTWLRRPGAGSSPARPARRPTSGGQCGRRYDGCVEGLTCTSCTSPAARGQTDDLVAGFEDSVQQDLVRLRHQLQRPHRRPKPPPPAELHRRPT